MSQPLEPKVVINQPSGQAPDQMKVQMETIPEQVKAPRKSANQLAMEEASAFINRK